MNQTQIEKKWQQEWQKAGLFKSNPDDRKKLFLTVAYPYPSGAMHIGHGRTYTVPDVYARFKRMQGYNVLLPMAWHVTGAPVIGIAKRIRRKDPWTLEIYKNVHKVPEKELENFSDPHYIVDYFSNEYRKDMSEMGYSIDWRREFKTIDPQYQKFIEWQICKLKSKGLIRKGAHPVKYCPECENPVGDHDLMEGEGVGINELTLIKFAIDGSYLVPATFRPETLFGVTNLWLNPQEAYVKIKIDRENWIISKKALYNFSHQKKNIEVLEEVDARKLIGKEAVNPLTKEKHIILPASFVDPEYASGVVYSVPGHAPADYIALEDLKKDQKLLAKYSLQEKVHNLKPRNVIQLKGFGQFPAEEIIQQFKVINQQDTQLKDATNELYKLEHSKGIMSEHIPEYSNMPVAEAREKIIQHLQETGNGSVMYEFAERPVICRCGGKCVVRILEDQWFLKYSDPQWKKITLNCLDRMQMVPEEVRANFEYYLNWFQDWACSRRIGLGTKLPWDKEWIIEPLSDSTIYMAYYTIAPHIQKINASDLDDSFFDHIFLKKGQYKGKIDDNLLQNAANEFNYWYPLDWRLSAKDLIGNHLTFHLFHHTAIFAPENWPLGAVVFGMGLLEGHKMSSSKGNVILLSEAIKTHGADVVRLFLMSSAEPWQDFDWREEEVKGTKKRLEWFIEFADKVNNLSKSKINLGQLKSLPNELKPINRWLVGQVNMRTKNATQALEGFQTRKALQEALFLLKKDIDYFFYRIKHDQVNQEELTVLIYVLNIWIRLLAPFIPHTAEELWNRYGGQSFVSQAPWPEYKQNLIDLKIQKAEELVQGLLEDIKELKKILKTQPKIIHVYLAPEWKWKVLELAYEVGKPDVGKIMVTAIQNNLHENKKELASYVQKVSREMTKIKYVGKIDEYNILTNALDFLSQEADAKIQLYQEPTYDPQGKSQNAMPYKPAIYME